MQRRKFIQTTTALATTPFLNNASGKNDYDLIVVGAGTAGMPCAITAAEKGAKVLVVEKTNMVGGTLHITGGHMSAGGTRHQQEHNILDSPDAHFQDVLRISKNTVPEKIARLATDEAPKTIDWLQSLGFEFAPESPRIVYGHVPYTVARTQYGKDAGKSILKVLLPLWDKFVASGNITVLLNHTLIDLVKKGDKTLGIRVKSTEGEKVFLGKNTVLAAGGYAANASMFAQKHPNKPPLVSTATLSSMGEGITIAEKHGAQFWNADTHISSLGGVEVQPNSGRVDFANDWAMVFTTAYRPTREIYVNAYGMRFMDEANPDPDYRERAVAQQPGAKFWVIFDALNLFSNNQLLMYNWTVEKLYAECAKGQCAWYANSINDLANRTKLPNDNLKKTITDYNAMVAEGADYDYHRKQTDLVAVQQAPYFAVLTYASSLISFGGIKTNNKLQVLDNENKPIKNLYAIGEILGAGATTGNAFCGGMLVTPALSFGRILGRTLV